MVRVPVVGKGVWNSRHERGERPLVYLITLSSTIFKNDMVWCYGSILLSFIHLISFPTSLFLPALISYGHNSKSFFHMDYHHFHIMDFLTRISNRRVEGSHFHSSKLKVLKLLVKCTFFYIRMIAAIFNLTFINFYYTIWIICISPFLIFVLRHFDLYGASALPYKLFDFILHVFNVYESYLLYQIYDAWDEYCGLSIC